MEPAGRVNLNDDASLEKNSRLGLKIEGSEFEPLIRQLTEELAQKGLTFLPPCHLGDEWFVPAGITRASFVETDEQYKERVQFIHGKHDNDVIAEE